MMKKLIILVILLSGTIYAQPQTAAALGMGLNYSAMSRGTDALGWNPANLAMKGSFTSDISFLSFSTVTANNSFSWADVDYYFEKNKVLTEEEKNDFYNLVNEDGLKVYSDSYVNFLSYARPNMGISLSFVSVGFAKLPKDFFELAMQPTQIEKTYDLSDIRVDGYSAGKVSMAYARKYTIAKRKIAFGLQLNLYSGIGTVVTERSTAHILQTEEGKIVSYYDIEGRTSGSGGFGFGFDLGASTSIMKDKMDLSFSIKNLFASINWSGSPEGFRQFGNMDSLSIDKVFDGEYDKIDTTWKIDSFSESLPVTILLGAAWRLNKELTVTADWKQGLDERYGNTFTPRIGIGVEYYATKILPLRGGITFGGNTGTLFALGSGLRFSAFDFDASFGMSRGLWPTQTTGLVSSFSFRVKM